MARILYGVQGDHNGHINRALSVAELLAGHELLFVGGGNAMRARDAGYAFEQLPVMGTQVRDNRVQALPTFAGMLRNRLEQGAWLRRLGEVVKAFDPDLILTDYEYYTPRAALASGRPCYSLDHMQVISRTRYRLDPGQAVSGFISRSLMDLLLPGMSAFFMISFHQPPLVEPERDAIFGPVPRSDILHLKAVQGEHALMYLPGCNPETICALFGGRKREYRVYGLGALPERGNVKFCPPGRETFLEDIASAAYVVCCGGHGTLTEALYLGKPCLCFPGSFLYEQFWNSHFIQARGYGRYFPVFAVSPEALDAFEASLECFASCIREGHFDGREALRDHLENMLKP